MPFKQSTINKLKTHFLSKRGDNVVQGVIKPDQTDTRDLGTASKRFDTVHAKTVIADTISGDTGSDADTVDGFHAAASPTPNTLLALDASSVFPTSVYPDAVLLNGSRTMTANLHISPTSVEAPLVLGANAVDQTVTGLRADSADIQVSAGAGLTGGGFLYSDISLSVDFSANAPSTIQPDAAGAAGSSNNPARLDHVHAISTNAPTTDLSASTSNQEGGSSDFARADHVHAIISYADSTVGGQENNILQSDASGNLKLNILELADRLTTELIDSYVGTSLALQPDQDLNLSPGGNRVRTTADVAIQSDNYTSQVTGWRIGYDGAGDFRYLYTDEMHAKAFIADIEQALAGGEIITKSVAKVAQDFTLPSQGNSDNLVVEEFAGYTGQVFVDGDIIRLRQFTRNEQQLTIADAWGTVTYQSRDGSANPPTQTYTFTRGTGSEAGSATGTIEEGTLALDYGQGGAGGYFEINAADGLNAANSPYSQVVSWTTHPATGQLVRTRLGNLRGIFAIDDEYGLYAGDGVTDSDKFLRVSSDNIEAHNLPIRLYDGANQTIVLEPGTDPYLAIGDPIPTGWLTQTGIWTGRDSGLYKAYVGEVDVSNNLVKGWSWDGSTFRVKGDVIIGPGNAYSTTALLYLPFDGPDAYKYDFQLDTHGHLGQQPTAQQAVTGRKGKYGKGVVVASDRTNYIKNPSFKVGKSSWGVNSELGESTIATTDFRFQFGGRSLRFAKGANEDTSHWSFVTSNPGGTITVEIGVTVWFSAYIENPNSGSVYLALYDGTTALQNSSYYGTSGSGTVENSSYREFTRVVGSWTNDTGSPVEVHLRVVTGQLTSSQKCFIDGVQVELSDLTPYFDGSFGEGHSWGGTAHNSISTRSKGKLSYDLEMPEEWSVSFWYKPDLAEGINTYNMYVFDWAYDSNNVFAIRIDTLGNLYARYFSNGVGTNIVSGIVNHDETVYLTVTWDGTTLSFYRDAELVGTATPTEIGVSVRPDTVYVGTNGSYNAHVNGLIDDLLIVDKALSADEVQQIYSSDVPVNVTTNKFELTLTGMNKGKVFGHAGGLFGQAADGTKSFALVNEDGVTWGGFTADQGDVVLGENVSGSSAIFWNKSTGLFGFYGDGAGTPEAEIYTDGSIRAGSGALVLDSNGLGIYDTVSVVKEITWWFNTGSEYQAVGRVYGDYDTGGHYASISIEAMYDSDRDWNAPFIRVTAHDYAAGVATKMEISGDTGHIDFYSRGAHMLLLDSSPREVNVRPDTLFVVEESGASSNVDIRSDVWHGATSVATSGYSILNIRRFTSDGAAQIKGFGNSYWGLNLVGMGTTTDTSRSTSSGAPVVASAYVQFGSNWAALGANRNIFAVANGNTVRFIIDSDGDYFYDGTGSAYDEYDDAQLARVLDRELSPESVIQGEFDKYLQYNREDLERAGVATFNDDTDGSVFINGAQLARLHNGAIWQLYTKMKRYEQLLIEEFGVDPKLLEG